MQRWRTTGVLILLTVCSALLYGMVSCYAKAEDSYLYSLKKNEIVETIALENGNGKLQFYRDKDGNWLANAEREYQAEEANMALLVDALTKFPVERILEEEKPEYGLSHPAARVSFTTSAGNEHSFVLGTNTMTQNDVYIKDEDTGRVVITGIGTVTMLDGGLGSFRSRRIFSVDVDNLTDISLKKKGRETLALKLIEGQWQMSVPYIAPARMIELSEFIKAMKDWNVYGFADTALITEEEAGLSGEGSFLTLCDKDGREQTLEIGSSSGAVVPVRNGGKDDILLLYTDEVNLSVLEADKLLFFAPLKAGVDEISEITLEIGSETITFQVDSENDIFTCNGRPVDSEGFYSFFVSYIGMAAAGGDTQSPAEGADTLAELRTEFKNGSKVEVQLLERDGSTCYMVVNNSLSGFYLRNEKVMALVKKLERLSDY